jgi:hypothetical protein
VEENLNLFSARELGAAARAAGFAEIPVESVSLFGLPTNLILATAKP